MRKTVAAFGELLWDILPDGKVLGGAPANFAYRINNLGDFGGLISRLGDDADGAQARLLLQQMGMDDTWIQTDPVHPTGTVNVFLDENRNPDYVINPDVAYDHIAFDDAVEALASRADCLYFGTLAQRAAPARETLAALLQHARPDAPRLLDINLRKDCYSAETIQASLDSANILKLNEDEIGMLQSLCDVPGEGIIPISRYLMARYNLDLCLVTCSKAGAIALAAEKTLYAPGYDSPLVDPLGCGDAFSAGFIQALLRDRPLEECLDQGNLLGSLVAGQRGATEPISLAQLDQFRLKPWKRVYREEFSQYSVL